MALRRTYRYCLSVNTLTVTPLQATWSLSLVIVTANFEVRQMKVVVFLVILFYLLSRGTEEMWEKLWEQPKFQTTNQLQTAGRRVLDTLTSRNTLSSLQTAICLLYWSCTAHWSLQVPRSGHNMYRTVVTICTASLTFNNSTFCPHSVFMCFVWISEKTAIISLYSINWLVCITQRECVYCAVRTERDLWHVWEIIEMHSEPWKGNMKKTIRTT
jgi:hypothetical protein